MVAKGHAVQSHSISHNKDDSKRDDETVRREYAGSKQALEDNIPGNQCLTLAYPWGKGKADIAKEYYIAARGTPGMPSQVNRINYLNTSKGGPGQDQINAILGKPAKTKWLNDKRYVRGWIQPLWHYVPVGHNKEEKQASREKAVADVALIAENKDQLWIDTFVNVAKYGQERDTAALKVEVSDESKIELSLTDRMHDGIFTYPLTIKVRLPENWKGVQAVQADASIKTTFINHEDKPYALVYGVPDKGLISISEGPAVAVK